MNFVSAKTEGIVYSFDHVRKIEAMLVVNYLAKDSGCRCRELVNIKLS